MIQDVEVIVIRETQPMTQAGFGLPLILATNATKPYAEYTDITGVKADYPETTAAYKIAARVLGQSPRPQKIAIFGVTYDPAMDTPDVLTGALSDLVETNNDWFYLLCDQQGDEEITALSNWIDTQKKIYFASTGNKDLVTQLESFNTVLMYHHDPTQYPAEGWVGVCAPKPPGSITWKFKTITGVTEAQITAAELITLHENGGNSYVRKHGILQSSEGLTTAGEYIDVMQSQYFIEARLIEEVSRLFYTHDKVPYDNSGIAMVAAACGTVMKQATDQGMIAKDADGNGLWTVTTPDRANIPASQVASRKLDGVYVEATLAGAIHGATIRVLLKY